MCAFMQNVQAEMSDLRALVREGLSGMSAQISSLKTDMEKVTKKLEKRKRSIGLEKVSVALILCCKACMDMQSCCFFLTSLDDN